MKKWPMRPTAMAIPLILFASVSLGAPAKTEMAETPGALAPVGQMNFFGSWNFMALPVGISPSASAPDVGGPSAGLEVFVHVNPRFLLGAGFSYRTALSFDRTNAADTFAYRGAYDALLASARCLVGSFYIQGDLGYALWDTVAWTGGQFHHGVLPSPVPWNGLALGGGMGWQHKFTRLLGVEVFARGLWVVPLPPTVGVGSSVGILTGAAFTIGF